MGKVDLSLFSRVQLSSAAEKLMSKEESDALIVKDSEWRL